MPDDAYEIWPGLLFARTDHARRYGVDFSLSPGHDTGSANRHALLRELDREALRWPSEHRLQVRGDGSDYQRDFVVVIDGWIHTINASYWKRLPDKDDVILELLHRY